MQITMFSEIAKQLLGYGSVPEGFHLYQTGTSPLLQSLFLFQLLLKGCLRMMIFDTKKHFLCRLNEVNIAPI